MTIHIHKLYKTAYSPLYAQYVEITNAHQDDRGEWIFTARIPLREDGRCDERVLFRPYELTNFCL